MLYTQTRVVGTLYKVRLPLYPKTNNKKKHAEETRQRQEQEHGEWSCWQWRGSSGEGQRWVREAGGGS